MNIKELIKMLPTDTTPKELFGYFYHLGAADGIVKSLNGGKPDFNKRFDYFIEEAKKGTFNISKKSAARQDCTTNRLLIEQYRILWCYKKYIKNMPDKWDMLEVKGGKWHENNYETIDTLINEMNIKYPEIHHWKESRIISVNKGETIEEAIGRWEAYWNSVNKHAGYKIPAHDFIDN